MTCYDKLAIVCRGTPCTALKLAGWAPFEARGVRKRIVLVL